MIHPGAALQGGDTGARVGGRLRLVMLVAAIAAFAAFLPASANAAISSTLDQTFANPAAGANSTYTNIQNFSLSEAPPHDDNDDLRKWILDGPAGQVGNVNAIPYDQRCTLDQFNTTVGGSPPYTTACPGSSIVGIAAVVFGHDGAGIDVDGNGGSFTGVNNFGTLTGMTRFSGVPTANSLDANGSPGTIYLLQTSPEVPTTLATFFHLTGARTKSILQPVTSGTDGDFRIRVIPADDSVHPVTTGPTPLFISQIMQRLHAKSGAGMDENAWLYNPTRCDGWTGYSYAREYDATGNENADSNPDVENPADGYKKSAGHTVTPDCATLPSFAPSTSVTMSTTDRDSHPQVDFTVNGIGSMGNDYPKKTVTTLPASMNIDVTTLPAPCETANRDANTCPASSKIGTAKVTTPLLTAGMTGDVYMIRGTGKALPDLSIFFNNPPNSIRPFRMDGATTYVGPRGNQIETTFDNGPQNPFSSFTLTITGGDSGLLKINKCPTGTSSPEDGPITFAMTGFSGQTASTSTTPALKDCFGVDKLKKIRKCVKSKLKVSPGYDSRDQISKAELWIKAKGSKKFKKVKTVKKSPFRFSYKLSNRYKKGKHSYRIRAVYKASTASPSGTVKTRTSSFKRC